MQEQRPFIRTDPKAQLLQVVEDVQVVHFDGHIKQLPPLKKYPAIHDLHIVELEHVGQIELHARHDAEDK
jgi:hypothetical protein